MITAWGLHRVGNILKMAKGQQGWSQGHSRESGEEVGQLRGSRLCPVRS